MKTQLFNLILLVVFCSTSCHSKKETMSDNKSNSGEMETKTDEFPFVIAKNYFVKNPVDSITNPKIESEEVFNSYFGMATTMSKNGKPTTIDFDKEYAIAVVLPTTNIATKIKPVSLKKGKDDSVVLKYEVILGNKQSYTSRPFLLLLVDKKYNGNLSLKRVE
jgi:hypothetical protein